MINYLAFSIPHLAFNIMLESLLQTDYSLMETLNFPAYHNLNWDTFFFNVSKIGIWFPPVVYMLWVIFRTKKKEGWLILVGIILVFLLTDRITSGLMKPFFERLRPSHDPNIMDHLSYAFGYTGGKYGFPSSHAGNSFAIATFLTLLFRNKFLTFTIFFWAVLCSYSRIYLGVHFPGDITVGALCGVLLGWVSFKIVGFLKEKFPQYTSDEKFRLSHIHTLCFIMLAEVAIIGIVSGVFVSYIPQ